MFKEFFTFEIKQGFKKPSFWIFLSILAFIGLSFGFVASGIWGPDNRESNAFVNTAYSITRLMISSNASILGLFNSLMIIALMAGTVYKDYEFNTHSLFYTKPISKPGYFFGRFFGGFFFAFLIFVGLTLGFMIGIQSGYKHIQVGPFHLINYLQPFLVFILPNIFFQGIIFFSLTTFTRNSMFSYAFAIVLFVARSIADSVSTDIDMKTLAAMIEPTGSRAFAVTTEYWTPVEQNSMMVPLTGKILYNRLLWGGLAILLTFLCYFKFSFSQFMQPFALFGRKKAATISDAIVKKFDSFRSLPVVQKSFTFKATLSKIIFLARFEFGRTVRSVFFIVAVGLGLFYLFFSPQFFGAIYNVSTQPLTQKMLEAASGLMQFMILILAIFSTATMIWRERENKVDELVGASPVPNHVLFWSKFIGMMMIEAVMFLIIMVGSIAYQLSSGYKDVDIPQYIAALFGMKLLSFAVMTAFFIGLQTFFANKFVGIVTGFVLILILPAILPLLEWDNPLYLINSDGPELAYSDMNSFGHYPLIFIIYKIYWGAAILFLISFGIRFYARGKEKSMKARFRLSKYTFNAKAKLALFGSLIVFFVSGGFIFYNTNVLHKRYTSEYYEKLGLDFEIKYKHFATTAQPRIISSNVNVDIFPEKRGAELKGFFWLKNKTQKNIDTIIVNQNAEIKINELKFDKGFEEAEFAKDYGMHIFKMKSALMPGDSVKLNFNLSYFPVGFKTESETEILYNGTFFNNGVLPNIGYSEGNEISNNKTRKKYGLKPKERMNKINDSIAMQNTYIAKDADWINFECVLSTNPDQIAIAPGYLQKTWEEKGRKYFHYKMDCKILNFYPFLSARYDVVKDVWTNPADPNNKVNIEIYYHKVHTYNLDRMVDGIKLSLDYYTKNFSPYQHKQVRIIEFPRYATFAQSFPNTIPFSEDIGFVMKIDKDDPESIDMPLYVTAHEVAHQWWAHQVIGADVQGSTIMSETMSQYSALMVMEKKYGAAQMKKFLRYEMDKYLIGRTRESRKELPIMLAENQQYIHYNKGSLVMYALKDYIGEDTLNAALKRYIKKVAYQEPPYTTSVEFVKYLRDATPDSLKYVIKDLFETITLYNNSVKELSYTALPNGKYKVKITVNSIKYRADSLGKQKEIPLNDWIDIGVFAETKNAKGNKEDKELYLKKMKVTKLNEVFEIIVDEKPSKVGIDPYNKLIDRTPSNNTRKFGAPYERDAISNGGPMVISVGGGDD